MDSRHSQQRLPLEPFIKRIVSEIHDNPFISDQNSGVYHATSRIRAPEQADFNLDHVIRRKIIHDLQYCMSIRIHRKRKNEVCGYEPRLHPVPILDGDRCLQSHF